MKSALIRLFNAVEVKSNTELYVTSVIEKTIKRGFIFSPVIMGNFSNNELYNLILLIEKEIGLTPDQLNNSFHKSWKKIRDADITQLVFEQLIHYFTTYGFKNLGIYNKDYVYIPTEKLKIPEIDITEIKLIVIKGYTKKEIKSKLLDLLRSGIALNETTIADAVTIAEYIKLTDKEIDSIKNKEVKVSLYDNLGIFPKDPIEFLRFLIYTSIDSTLLIKDGKTLAEIKGQTNKKALRLLRKYKNTYGLENLASIFYRYKPLWLAFKTNSELNTYINKIRKLAVQFHKPMKEDYLNNITAILKREERIDRLKLNEELNKVNTFRKIRLAYALKFRLGDVSSILYKIRNGKSYATEIYNVQDKKEYKVILSIVLNSIVKDIKNNVNGKKIYIPKYIKYALPATEKQFTGNLPSGTCISIPKNMIVGIHWENQPSYGIDLDLSLIGATKIGWDSVYRSEDGDILFSGDITDAPKPKGASEFVYIKRQTKQNFIMFVNYYNYFKEVEVPFKIIVAQKQINQLKKDYMVDPNSVLSIVKTNINKKQKVLGLVIITSKRCKFFFSESYLGNDISSCNLDYVNYAKNYMFDFYRNTINLNKLLEEAGGILVDCNDKCDIDLSPENIEKDTIINLVK